MTRVPPARQDQFRIIALMSHRVMRWHLILTRRNHHAPAQESRRHPDSPLCIPTGLTPRLRRHKERMSPRAHRSTATSNPIRDFADLFSPVKPAFMAITARLKPTNMDDDGPDAMPDFSIGNPRERGRKPSTGARSGNHTDWRRTPRQAAERRARLFAGYRPPRRWIRPDCSPVAWRLGSGRVHSQTNAGASRPGQRARALTFTALRRDRTPA
jgi:hypothetical protein